MVQFDTWSSSIRLEDLLYYTEGAVEEMALVVYPSTAALPRARTTAIWSALVNLREWHA